MKKVLILSGKGGTGKTTVAASFIHFSNAQAIADCDVDAPNLHLVTSLKGTPTITDFIGGEKAVIDPEKCIGCEKCREHCRFHAIEIGEKGCQIQEYSCEGCGVCAFVCPQDAISLRADLAGRQELYPNAPVFSTAALKMGRGNSGKLVTNVKLAMLKHAPETDLAVIDGSPGIGCPVIASMSGVDLVLIVAEPSFSGISDLKRLVKTAQSFQVPIAVCVNKYDVNPKKAEEIQDFCLKHNLAFNGLIPYDKQASEAVNAGKSIAETDCPMQKALKQVYQKTINLLNL